MSIESREQEEQDDFHWWKVIAVFVLVFVFGLSIGIVPWVTFALFPRWGQTFPENAGLWGDSFGFVNALLSALAFAGVLVTLWMQRRELQLQREEMKLTRLELKATRDEHRRMAKSQEESENRLFLAAYMNSLESLRQYSQWRMSADPATHKSASFPVVEGLVVQARVSQSLQLLVRDLEPEIQKLHPTLRSVSEKGSWVWQLEQFLNVYLSIRHLKETHRGRSDDVEAFNEAVSISRTQFEQLEELKKTVGPSRQDSINSILANAPDLNWVTGDVFATNIEAREQRRKYFSDLDNVSREILHHVMVMCHE